jgi:hypothetical protein
MTTDHVANEWTYAFDAKQVFTTETLEEMRDRLALTDRDLSLRQFAAIINHRMTVTLTLGVAGNGFRYIKLSNDAADEVRRGEFGNKGPNMELRFSEFSPSVQNILIDHLNNGELVRGTTTDIFLRYQMAVDDLDREQDEAGQLDLLLAASRYDCKLPSRKQVLALYHDWYLLPAEEEDE